MEFNEVKKSKLSRVNSLMFYIDEEIFDLMIREGASELEQKEIESIYRALGKIDERLRNLIK